MTIIYLVPYLANTGPINVLYNIVKHLDRKRYTPKIVTLDTSSKYANGNKAIFEELGIEIIEHSYSHWYLQFHLSSIAKDIERRFYKSDTLFHAHTYYPTLILAYMENHYRITTIHNICAQDFVLGKGTIMGHYLSYTFKKALKKLNVCVTISDFMKSYYSHDKTLKLTTVYNGVEQPLAYTDTERAHIKQRLEIPSETKVFLCPANISYLKNQKSIITALKQSQRTDFVILFAGKGLAEKECRALAQDDKRFRFLGFQMDLSPFWAITDFLISASRSEGMPMAVLEAIVQGIPPILSDIPQHRELLLKVMNGTATCFTLDDNNSLLHTFESVLHSDIDKDKIRQTARQLFTSQIMSYNYSRVYDSLFAQHHLDVYQSILK